MISLIEIKNLTKYYGKHRGVENIDLKVNKGELFGFIGQNGAGKSTTIRLLLDFIRPTSGECKIFGLSCINNSKEIKKQVGYVPSEVNFYPHMKVSELLGYSQKLHKVKASDEINRLCSLFEIDINVKIGELSLGNKKKVALVQAMFFKPQILIMDEPTNGLDPLMQIRLFEELKTLTDNGVTVFLSSHNLSEVQKYCTRVAIIREGKIVQISNVSEIINNNIKKVSMILNNMEDVQKLNKYSPIIKENLAEFLHEGNINELIACLATIDIGGLEITEPSLEDSFMKYYGKEEK